MNPATYDTIANILVDDFHVERQRLDPQMPLAELGLDSLALMEFVFAVEDAFHLRVPEDQLDPRAAGFSLQQLCTVIDDHSAEPAPATALYS